jgi:hypothetical protein
MFPSAKGRGMADRAARNSWGMRGDLSAIPAMTSMPHRVGMFSSSLSFDAPPMKSVCCEDRGQAWRQGFWTTHPWLFEVLDAEARIR